MTVDVLRELKVVEFVVPNNGSSPFWCYGSPPIARDGETVVISVPETGVGIAPTSNTRLQLFVLRGDEAGASFRREFVAPRYDQREPCPIARLPGRPRFEPDAAARTSTHLGAGVDVDGDDRFRDSNGNRILVSINPSVAAFRGAPDGSSAMYYCEPYLLDFESGDLSRYPEIIKPAWDQRWPFTDHSYRGIASDFDRDEFLLLNVEGYLWRPGYEGRFHWWFADGAAGSPGGKGADSAGRIDFPVRCCYPIVTLRERQSYVVAISDIDEPNATWMDYKREITGQQWDFDFRNLYAVYNPDVTRKPYSEPFLVDSVEETSGHIRHLDAALDGEGNLHVLYIRRNVWKTFMRDRFFPYLQLTIELVHATIREDQVLGRQVLMTCREEKSGVHEVVLNAYGPGDRWERFRTNDRWPDYAAFYTAPDNRLVVLAAVSPQPTLLACELSLLSGERRMLLQAGVEVPFSVVPSLFFVAGPRQGSTCDGRADLMIWNRADPDFVRYAQLSLCL